MLFRSMEGTTYFYVQLDGEMMYYELSAMDNKQAILLSIGTKVSLSPIGQPANAVQEAVLPVQNIATTPSRTPEMVDGEANSEATA